MNRRTVFKRLAMASAAALIVPSCVSDPKKISVALNNLSITGDEEELLGDIADVIVPTTDTPGACAVEAHLFALVMVDDCMDKSEQKTYLKGMRNFEEALKSLTGKSFRAASPAEKLEMVTALEQHKKELSQDVQVFYARTRSYILQGYLSSEHFLTNVKPYKLVPGPVFEGCKTLHETKPLS
jgi:hypothetical protein